MKRVVFLGMCLAIFLSFSNEIDAQKIGYLNSNLLLSEMPAVQEANANLESLKTQLQKKGQQMLDELRKEYETIAQKEQRGEISPKELEVEAKRLKEKESSIAKYEQDMISQLQNKEKEELQPILDRVNQAIADVADENDFSYIFDSSTGILLFADKSQDVSEMVKSKLGI